MSPEPLSSVTLAHVRALVRAGCDNGGYCHYCRVNLILDKPHDRDCAYMNAVEFLASVDA